MLRCHTDAPGGSWNSGYVVRIAVVLSTHMGCEFSGVEAHHPAQKNLGKRCLVAFAEVAGEEVHYKRSMNRTKVAGSLRGHTSKPGDELCSRREHVDRRDVQHGAYCITGESFADAASPPVVATLQEKDMGARYMVGPYDGPWQLTAWCIGLCARSAEAEGSLCQVCQGRAPLPHGRHKGRAPPRVAQHNRIFVNFARFSSARPLPRYPFAVAASCTGGTSGVLPGSFKRGASAVMATCFSLSFDRFGPFDCGIEGHLSPSISLR